MSATVSGSTVPAPTPANDVLTSDALVFYPSLEAVWNRTYVESVQITMDVIENHLFQVLSNLAMEPPVRTDSESIRDEKARFSKRSRRWNYATSYAVNSAAIAASPAFSRASSRAKTRLAPKSSRRYATSSADTQSTLNRPAPMRPALLKFSRHSIAGGC
jgi:hypothetical protein